MSDTFEQKPPINYEGGESGIPKRETNLTNERFPEMFDLSRKSLVSIPERILPLVVKSGKNADILESLVGTTVPEKKKTEKLPYQAHVYSSYPGTIYLFSSQIQDPDYPHTKLQIARIEFDPESGKVNRVTRNVSAGLFRTVLADFPEDSLFGQIKKTLNIPDPSIEDINEKARVVEEATQVESAKEEILKLSRHDIFSGLLIENSSNTQTIHHVFQGEYSIARNDQVRFLSTFGASDCIIISIYYPFEHEGALAHIDRLTDEVETARIMKDILARKVIKEKGEERTKQVFQVTILGGTLASTRQLVDLYQEILKWNKDIEIQLTIGPVLTGESQSLALDSSSGEVKRFKPDSHLHPEWELSISSVMTRVGSIKTGGRKTARLSLPNG